MLHDVKRCQQLSQTASAGVGRILHRDVEITSYNDWAGEDDKRLQQRGEFVEELTAMLVTLSPVCTG